MLELILNHIQNITVEGTILVYNKDSKTFSFLYDIDGGYDTIHTNSINIEKWLSYIGVSYDVEDSMLMDSIHYEDSETIIYWLEK